MSERLLKVRRSRRGRWAAAVAITVVVGLVAAVGAVAGGGETDHRAEFAAFDAGTVPAPPAPAGQLARDGFGVFDRPADASDRPPAAALGTDAISKGAEPRNARLLRNIYGKSVYAVPVRGGTCLTSSDYSVANCRPDSQLSHPGERALFGVEGTVCSPYLASDEAAIYGLVANGVTEVRINRSAGEPMVVPVRDNLLLALLDRNGPATTTLSWTDASGVHSVRSPLPADSAADNCVDTDPQRAAAEQRAVSARAAEAKGLR